MHGLYYNRVGIGGTSLPKLFMYIYDELDIKQWPIMNIGRTGTHTVHWVQG